VWAGPDARAELADRWKAMISSTDTPKEIVDALISLYARVSVDITTIKIFENRAK